MGLKVYRPTTPARRDTSVDDFADVTTSKPFKGLLLSRKNQAGRNNQGLITIRHRGCGAKRHIRMVDFAQDKFDVAGRVETIEYDPNRKARISLICFKDGERRYILTPAGLKVGDEIISSRAQGLKIKVGNRMPLEYLPVGSFVSNIEMVPGKGGQMARAAGMQVQLMAVEGRYAHLRLPSTEVRMVPKECLATLGVVSNAEISHLRIGKAGRMRHMGWRPTVRGKVMNPVDHPHGGGEGNCPIGLKNPKTPWGKPALGVKTRKHNKKSEKLIIQRRTKKA